MLNAYLKVTDEKNRITQIVRFQVSFWGAPTHIDIIELSNILWQLKSQRFESKTVCGFSVIFF